jgi:predicted short-subunit dehydrogenase-like oxidoreductase (DUF2520 family)
MHISILGSGNVAQVLTNSFIKAGHLVAVYGRNNKRVKAIAGKSGAIGQPLSKITAGSDIYIIAVTDDAIPEITRLLPADFPVVHTSGATDLKALSKFKKHGVFYPVNTVTQFQKQLTPLTPVCLESNSPSLQKQLRAIAKSINAIPCDINSMERLTIHLAAVLINNFTNELYRSAFELMKKANISPGIIHSLMQSTVDNAILHDPFTIQTGPARRNDKITIKKHLSILQSNPDLSKIYKDFSKVILKHYQ